eukprot:gene9119-6409_t
MAMFAQDGLQMVLSVLMGGVPVIDRRPEQRTAQLSSSVEEPWRGLRGEREPTFNFPSSFARPAFGPVPPDNTPAVALREGRGGLDPPSDSSGSGSESDWNVRTTWDGPDSRGRSPRSYWDSPMNAFGEPSGLVDMGTGMVHVRMSNSFGRDIQSQLENIMLRTLILEVLQHAGNRDPAFPPMTNAEKKFLEFSNLTGDLADHLCTEGYEECTVCQESFHDIWRECQDYARCPSVSSSSDGEASPGKGPNEPKDGGATPQEEEEAGQKAQPEKYHRRHDVLVCRLPCNHFFCKDCVLKWVGYTSTCPNCRLVLQDLADKYSGGDNSPSRPSWWHGTKEPEQVEVLPDTDAPPDPTPAITNLSPVPVPAHWPRPPSRPRDSAPPRQARAYHPPAAAEAQLQTPLEPPPPSEPSTPPSVQRVSTNTLDATTGEVQPEETVQGPSEPESHERFRSPSVLSPHRVPPPELGEEIVFDAPTQGNGVRAVRRIRRTQRRPQERLSTFRLRSGPRNSSESGSDSLFPRIQLSRASGVNRMRTMRLFHFLLAPDYTHLLRCVPLTLCKQFFVCLWKAVDVFWSYWSVEWFSFIHLHIPRSVRSAIALHECCWNLHHVYSVTCSPVLSFCVLLALRFLSCSTVAVFFDYYYTQSRGIVRQIAAPEAFVLSLYIYIYILL